MEQLNQRVLNLEEACQLLGYKKSYVYKLTSAGIIPYSKPNGKNLFFCREKLENWMLSNPNNSLEENQLLASTYVNTHN